MSSNPPLPESPEPPFPPLVVLVPDPAPLKSTDVFPSADPASPPTPAPDRQLGVGDRRIETQDLSLQWAGMWLFNVFGKNIISYNNSYATAIENHFMCT